MLRVVNYKQDHGIRQRGGIFTSARSTEMGTFIYLRVSPEPATQKAKVISVLGRITLAFVRMKRKRKKKDSFTSQLTNA